MAVNSTGGRELVECIRNKYEGGGLDNTSLAMNVGGGAGFGTNCHEMKWEFVQMDKIHKAQSNIYALKCIVLAQSGISHVFTAINEESAEPRKFHKCIELDLSENAVSSWWRLAEILRLFPELRTLRLSKNPLAPITDDEEFTSLLDTFTSLHCAIKELSLNSCQFGEVTANRVLELFPHLEELYLASNELTTYLPSNPASVTSLRRLDIQDNPIVHFERVWALEVLPALEFLNLSYCRLERIRLPPAKSSSPSFPKLDTLFLQYNTFSDWQSIDELARLPALNKLMLKGVLLPGARGMDSREMIIAKMPSLLVLDRCDISPAARRSAELLFLSRFGSLPAAEVGEHQATLLRLLRLHDFTPLTIEVRTGSRQSVIGTSVQSVRLKLSYAGRVLERDVSVQLSIHKLVGLASALFDFDEVREVEIQRKKGYPVERVKRLTANLLRQFDLEDGDSIAFI